MSEDLRVAPRRRTLKGARIVFNEGSSTMSCQVRNLSETGTLLKLVSVVGTPDTFELLLDDGGRFACTVVRRTATDLGVQFG
jgi:hypothetical protein